jgi:hypothetical protein
MKLKTIGDKFMLIEDTWVEDYKIPEGFITDFATIPRFALSLMGRPSRKEFRRASLLHDYLLVENLASNEKASKLFYKILLEDGTKPFKAYIMYLSVRYLRKVYKSLK